MIYQSCENNSKIRVILHFIKYFFFFKYSICFEKFNKNVINSFVSLFVQNLIKFVEIHLKILNNIKIIDKYQKYLKNVEKVIKCLKVSKNIKKVINLSKKY